MGSSPTLAGSLCQLARTVRITNPGTQTSIRELAIAPVQIQASPTDTGTLSYSATGLPVGLSIDPSTGEITDIPTVTGTSTVSVLATDSTGPSVSTRFSWTVSNGTVTVTNFGDQTGYTGLGVSLQMLANATDGGRLTYGATGLPAQLSIDPSTGLISGTPATAGTSAVTVTATDANGPTGSATFQLTIDPQVVTVRNPGDQSSGVGTAVRLQIQASDSLGGTLGYSATGLPAGLSIAPGTGLIAGTPTTAGRSIVTVTATHLGGPAGSTIFSWTVSAGELTGIRLIFHNGANLLILTATGPGHLTITIHRGGAQHLTILEAGRQTVKLSLSRKLRKLLAHSRTRKLKIPLNLYWLPAGGHGLTRTITITLRNP